MGMILFDLFEIWEWYYFTFLRYGNDIILPFSDMGMILLYLFADCR
jgi:hypothetical protein